MQNSRNIHATCIDLDQKGILLLGKSGSGKSDLALRLIQNKGAKLVADDRVDICEKDGLLVAGCPENISGLLEVRGIGIMAMPCKKQTSVVLAVELTASRSDIERLPLEEFITLCGISVPLLKLYPFDCSAPEKLVIKLHAMLDKSKKNPKID